METWITGLTAEHSQQVLVDKNTKQFFFIEYLDITF